MAYILWCVFNFCDRSCPRGLIGAVKRSSRMPLLVPPILPNIISEFNPYQSSYLSRAPPRGRLRALVLVLSNHRRRRHSFETRPIHDPPVLSSDKQLSHTRCRKTRPRGSQILVVQQFTRCVLHFCARHPPLRLSECSQTTPYWPLAIYAMLTTFLLHSPPPQ